MQNKTNHCIYLLISPSNRLLGQFCWTIKFNHKNAIKSKIRTNPFWFSPMAIALVSFRK